MSSEEDEELMLLLLFLLLFGEPLIKSMLHLLLSIFILMSGTLAFPRYSKGEKTSVQRKDTSIILLC